MKPKTVIIGCRGSDLAIQQASFIRASLQRIHGAGVSVDIRIIKTTGDKLLNSPLSKIDSKGIFVKEIEEALLDGSIDLAVHSMKDMPTELPEKLAIGAVPERGEYRDAFVSTICGKLSGLPVAATVGTGSLRRKVQILRMRPDLNVVDVRGNVGTRLKKLDRGDFQALVLSAAGLERLGFQNRVCEKLDFLPAVGQGALAIEIRKGDALMRGLISPLNHPDSEKAVNLERFFLKCMGGGCQVPMGAHVEIDSKSFFMNVFIGSLDGLKILEHKERGFLHDAESQITLLAHKLLEAGAQEILGKV